MECRVVSYTHLDVYKRQTYIVPTKQTLYIDNGTSSLQAMVNHLETRDLVNVSAWKGTEKIAERNGADAAIIPVSYTHLDVYKRQY